VDGGSGLESLAGSVNSRKAGGEWLICGINFAGGFARRNPFWLASAAARRTLACRCIARFEAGWGREAVWKTNWRAGVECFRIVYGAWQFWRAENAGD